MRAGPRGCDGARPCWRHHGGTADRSAPVTAEDELEGKVRLATKATQPAGPQQADYVRHTPRSRVDCAPTLRRALLNYSQRSSSRCSSRSVPTRVRLSPGGVLRGSGAAACLGPGRGGGRGDGSGALGTVSSSAVIHTDDIAWEHSRFGWADLLIGGILIPVQRGRALSYRPPRWDEHGQEGSIDVPAGCLLLIIEGDGAGRRESNAPGGRPDLGARRPTRGWTARRRPDGRSVQPTGPARPLMEGRSTRRDGWPGNTFQRRAADLGTRRHHCLWHPEMSYGPSTETVIAPPPSAP